MRTHVGKSIVGWFVGCFVASVVSVSTGHKLAGFLLAVLAFLPFAIIGLIELG